MDPPSIHCLETQEYEYIIRTHLPRAQAKKDVYVAKNKEKSLVIVKGPYQDIDMYGYNNRAELIQSFHEWKIQNGLPILEYTIKQMIPDRWHEGTCCGIRNSVCRIDYSYFIITPAMFKEEDINIKHHKYREWPETEVLDREALPTWLGDITQFTEQEMIDYVHAILFRWIAGLGSVSDEYFIRVGGRVISVDEDIQYSNVNIYKDLGYRKSFYIHSWVTEHYEKLGIQTWTLLRNRHGRRRLDFIRNHTTCLTLFQHGFHHNRVDLRM